MLGRHWVRAAGVHLLVLQDALHVVRDRDHSWRVWYSWCGHWRVQVRRSIVRVLNRRWRLLQGIWKLASHGTSHEQLLEGGNPRLHAAVLVQQAVVALFQMPNVLGSLAEDLN
jgi:hypothetical protein